MAPSRALSAPWIDPPAIARAVAELPAVICVPLKATAPFTEARLMRMTSLPLASLATT